MIKLGACVSFRTESELSMIGNSSVCTCSRLCVCACVGVQNCPPWSETVGCWLVCQLVCASVCLCVFLHPFPAGFPVQSPQSDTVDDGCAAVICFIRLGVSLASSTRASTTATCQGMDWGGGESPICAPVQHLHPTGSKDKIWLSSCKKKIWVLNRAAGPGKEGKELTEFTVGVFLLFNPRSHLQLQHLMNEDTFSYSLFYCMCCWQANLTTTLKWFYCHLTSMNENMSLANTVYERCKLMCALIRQHTVHTQVL